MKYRRMLWVAGVSLIAVLMLGMMVAVLGQKSAAPVSAQTQPGTPSTTVSPGNPYPVPPTGSITVQGTGVVILKPDVVQLSVGVQLKAPTVAEAQQQSADASAKITEALKNAGIKPEDVMTVNYSINPDYLYEPNQAPKLNGYQIVNSLQVTIRDLTKAGSIIDAASAAGANQVNGITFTVENNTEALKQARAAAVADAKAKAEQLAAAGSVSVGSITNIVEGAQNGNPIAVPMAANDSKAAGVASTQIEGGQLKVVVNVQVTYAIK